MLINLAYALVERRDAKWGTIVGDRSLFRKARPDTSMRTEENDHR